MNIAIIGKGTSAIITALHLIKNDHDVEFFYDPDKKPLSVGESTTPHIQSLIFESLHISIGDLLDAGIISYKNGIHYRNWGKGKPFRHHFHGGEVAFHFESGILNKFLHDHLENKLGIPYHAERVNGYQMYDDHVYVNGKEYDFVVNCTGWVDSDDYYKPIFETVNSAILYTKNEIIDPTYTLHTATPDGWEFGLPFPERGVTKCGYLYNDKLSNPEIEGTKISWTPRLSKKLIQNKFEAFNGNKLFFLEPLEALSLLYYDSNAEIIVRFLNNKRSMRGYIESNEEYLRLMTGYLTSLSWFYSYGSIYDTPFWKNVQPRANIHFNSQNLSNRIDSLLELYYTDSKFSKYRECNGTIKIGCFGHYDFKDMHSGMTQVPMDKYIEKYVNDPSMQALLDHDNMLECEGNSNEANGSTF
jgi:hypothetical protein